MSARSDVPLPCSQCFHARTVDAITGTDCFNFLEGSGLSDFHVSCLQHNHDWKVGARIGEASNPGPGPETHSGLLEGLGLRELIRDMVREAVKEAIKEAFGAGFLHSAPDPPVVRSVATVQAEKSRGKGDKPQGRNGQLATDGSASQNRAAKPGKGRGGDQQVTSPPQGNAWTTVERRSSRAEFNLRPQDWDAPLLLFSDVAKALDKNADGTCFCAVVRCAAEQRAILHRILTGSKHAYSVLAVSIGRETEQPADTQRRVPGRVGDALAFRQATVIQFMSTPTGKSPQPKGMKQQAVKIVPKATEVLAVRVSRTFSSKELWESFEKTPQKCIVQWLADRHVNALDSFAWKAEKGDAQGHQLYGLVRLLKSEAEAVLHASGQDGIFLDPTRSMNIKSRIEWVERRNKQEGHPEYHARAIKCAGDLGLIVKGSRLAVRHTSKADDKVPKIWIFEHVPINVDPEQAKVILEESFVDVTMMRARGAKGGRSFYFKGAHATNPDADLVPISLDTGEGIITAWARVAPPRSEKVQQRQLPVTAVPLATKQTFRSTTPVPMPAGPGTTPMEVSNTEAKGSEDQESGPDAHKKPEGGEPPSKRAAVAPELRQVPQGLKIDPQPKDGACAFHCFSQGLKKISKGKIDKHPRQLRAECVEHMQKHAEDYKASWDKKGPDGNELADWDSYIAAVSAESAYVSDLELRALARLYDVKVVLVPQLACFPPVVFHSGQKSPKRCLMLWYSERHLDLLVTEEGKRVPEDIAAVTAAINFDLRVGGKPTSSAASSRGSWGGPGTVFTDQGGAPRSKRSGSAASSGWKSQPNTVWTGPGITSGPQRTGGSTTHAPEAAEEPLDQQEAVGARSKRTVYHWQSHGQRRKTVKFFKCELCPYVVAVKDVPDLCSKRSNHCRRYHGGAGLPGNRTRNADYVNPVKGSRAQYAWVCPLCPSGITNQLRSALSSTTVVLAKRRHKQEHHPRVSDERWKRLCNIRALSVSAQRVTKMNHFVAKNLREDIQRQAQGFRKFTWPLRVCVKKTQTIRTVKFRTAWACDRCGKCFKYRKDLPAHHKTSRYHPKPCSSDKACKVRKSNLKRLGSLETWCRRNKQCHGFDDAKLSSIFQEARTVLRGEYVQP